MHPEERLRPARSHPNLGLLPETDNKGASRPIPRGEGRPKRRQRERSLSESDCQELQENAARWLLLKKAKKRYRSYMARIRDRRLWNKRYSSRSKGLEHDSEDSGFSTPNTSSSYSSWGRSQWKASLHDPYAPHHRHHGIETPSVHSMQNYSVSNQFRRSASSLTSTVSRVTSDIGSDITIPGMIGD